MLTDYKISETAFQTKTKYERIMPYIEFILLLLILQSALIFMTSGAAEDEEVIRFRLLAHSNAQVDQQVKLAIQSEIEPLIQNAVATSRSLVELEMNLRALENRIIEVANALSNGDSIKLERKETLFPPKRSGFFIHPQSMQDAYILTIGSGRGDNWWCSIFPKICFPDKAPKEEEEVTFFIWEWIKEIFS